MMMMMMMGLGVRAMRRVDRGALDLLDAFGISFKVTDLFCCQCSDWPTN